MSLIVVTFLVFSAEPKAGLALLGALLVVWLLDKL